MGSDDLARDLYSEICRISFIDPHSHIDPRKPTARTLDDILGYHYYTELTHSAGLEKKALQADVEPRERVRQILSYFGDTDNTAQYGWFVEIARQFLGFPGGRIDDRDADVLWDAAERVFSQPDWEAKVFEATNVEKIFLTNDFDDKLGDIDTSRYVPCLRTDDLVFHLDNAEVRRRLRQTTNTEIGDATRIKSALARLVERFQGNGAKACAVSLPPDFTPRRVSDNDLSAALAKVLAGEGDREAMGTAALGVFWAIAELCSEHELPFDLMIGVNRKVYADGVYQGQDLFDGRTSLIQYRELFNAFPEVTFCVSVLSSAQNQELTSYSWIFPNVVTSGHWWYSNIPAYISQDCRARLQAAPKTKQLGYYSDAYKLEFVLPKYNMYRRILAGILADDFVRPGVYTEEQAVNVAALLLRGNPLRVFRL